MYAIFQAKGKQWRAEPGATLRLPSLEAEPGEQVVFDDVLLTDRDGEIVVGRPSIDGAAVSAEVLRHGKGEKVVVFKMKRRKGYRRKQGHRQKFTEVRVVEITPGTGTSAKPKAAKKPAVKKAAEAEKKAAEKKVAEKKEPVAEKKAAETKPAAKKEPKAEKKKPAAKKKPAPKAEAPAGAVAEAIEAVDITPAAAELATEHGIDVSTIEGTGKDGRVLKSDVEKAIKQRDEEG